MEEQLQFRYNSLRDVCAEGLQINITFDLLYHFKTISDSEPWLKYIWFNYKLTKVKIYVLHRSCKLKVFSFETPLTDGAIINNADLIWNTDFESADYMVLAKPFRNYILI